jgi:nitrous oxide reductase accessory protein NosL
MKIRNALAGLAFLLVVAGLAYLGYRHFVPPRHQCDICGRPVYSDLKATVFLKGGGRIDACCARCALHFGTQRLGEVQRLTVDDTNTGENLDATEAAYVEGSEIEACHPASDAPLRELGVQYDLRFDRCLPSLLAFKSESEAGAFQKQHGGRVLSYAQAVESVRQR